tara:strand:- start:752 stop:910 length:159 start_codon:yes stop_codon:yes gene_type:complete
MKIDESEDWSCGCWIMKEFDTHSNKLRTIGRSYCKSKHCNRKLAKIKYGGKK